MAENAVKTVLEQISTKELKRRNIEEINEEKIIDEEMTFCLGCLVELAELLEGKEGEASKRKEG